MTEKLCLKWNDFQENTTTLFGRLRNDSDFTDVTLVCEDGEQVEAHKVILAASSPFFQNLLRRNKHPHPLIYMRGVKSEDMMAIVDFLYYGEVEVFQENMSAFMAIADELKVRGLTGFDTESNEELDTNPKANKKNSKYKKRKQKEERPTQNFDLGLIKLEDAQTFPLGVGDTIEPVLELEENNAFEEQSAVEETAVFSNALAETEKGKKVAVAGPFTDVEELDVQVMSMIQRTQNRTKDNKAFADRCTVCGKEGYKREVKDHIEAQHLEGVSLPCTFCGKVFRSRNGLRHHTAKHK